MLKELQHDGPVKSAAFSSDGRFMVTAATDKKARLRTMAGEPLKEFIQMGQQRPVQP